MKIKSKMAVTALAFVLSSGLAFAQGAPPPPDGQQGGAVVAGPGPGRGMGQGQFFAMRPGPDGRGQAWGRRGAGRMGGGRRGMGGRGFGGEGFLNNPMIRQRLGITAEQSEKIEQQNVDARKTEIRGRADLEVKRIELNQLLAADNPDRSAIDAKLQEVGAAQMSLEKASIDNRLAVRDILTPAQRKQLKDMRENGFQQMSGQQAGARTQRGRGPGGPGGRGGQPPAGGQAPPPPPANQ